MSEKKIAYCGLDCAVCPAFRAAERRTHAERQMIADQWSKEYHMAVKAEDIDCQGCTERSGPHVGYCAVCAIRACGHQKGEAVTTCAACPDYGCAKLENFIKNIPAARANLEEMRG